LVLTPAGISLIRSIQKLVNHHESGLPSEDEGLTNFYLHGVGIAMSGWTLFKLEKQGTWFNCFAKEKISLDGLLVDYAHYLNTANAVETTECGSLTRRQLPGYEEQVAESSLIDLGPERNPWAGMASFTTPPTSW
jgi:hypothetical protein